MTRRARVALRSLTGMHVEEVEASVLATDAALIDMARQQAEIPPDTFKGGEVVGS